MKKLTLLPLLLILSISCLSQTQRNFHCFRRETAYLQDNYKYFVPPGSAETTNGTISMSAEKITFTNLNEFTLIPEDVLASSQDGSVLVWKTKSLTDREHIVRLENNGNEFKIYIAPTDSKTFGACYTCKRKY